MVSTEVAMVHRNNFQRHVLNLQHTSAKSRILAVSLVFQYYK